MDVWGERKMKHTIDFVGKRKIPFTISLCIIVIGIIFNIINGTRLDIQFSGGAIISYSYTGEIDENAVQKLVNGMTEEEVSIQVNQNVKIAGSDETQNTISLSFSGNQSISLDKQKEITKALEDNFPENQFAQSESSSVDPTMGGQFLLKCLVAVGIAAVLMVVYVAFRFKKIGGWSAGVFALVALLLDVSNVYFTFIICRLPIDSNFIAVALMILGYSLNDTIVIYDRVRENRRLSSPKTDIGDIVNKSINQNLSRTINTSITTFAAITVVFIVSLIFDLPSVTSFALPMMVGIVSGCYTTNCIVGPLWVMWKKRGKKKKEEAAAEA
jgi:preprotein translocase subunit SecF